MVVGPPLEMYSDESEEPLEEVDVYRRKYQLIIERCEVIQQDNERLVNRIQQVKKILKRLRKERKFLMDRLDMHGDNWRNVPLPLHLEDHDEQTQTTKSRSKNKGGEGQKKVNNSGNGAAAGGNASGGTGSKRKSSKVDKNAPKRPANPYFQFCQEQRTTAIEEMASIGQTEPTKVEVTKHLANKWNTLTSDDKKIYYDMYEKSKERYNADMQVYALSKSNMENS